MAMTKKEKAEMQAAIDRAELLAALRWTAPVERDVDIPEEGYAAGWDYNKSSRLIWRTWTGSLVHGRGEAPKPNQRYYSATQGGRRLFSTPEKALAALRHELECLAAANLLAVDRRIKAKSFDNVGDSL